MFNLPLPPGQWKLPWSFGLSKPKVFPVVAAQTFGAHTEILQKVNVDVCASPADCDVVMVFCPVTSCVGSDVAHAMRNIPGKIDRFLCLLYVSVFVASQQDCLGF